MKTQTTTAAPIASALFGVSRDSRLVQILAALVLPRAVAKVQIPLWPVPITMQTYMVTLAGDARRPGAALASARIARTPTTECK